MTIPNVWGMLSSICFPSLAAKGMPDSSAHHDTSLILWWRSSTPRRVKASDPACGTAGFLISAWKHILKSNTKTRSGDLLTPDERKYLAANISGYDISPDMVRLSLVNMYLHGFTDPHIVEYDTLTSEEKWNEYADVILANPPFMSPKGGIKPHKRFSVQATRSEVLFVDYMAEHLTPNGRAAIIVPEGIIFQSQTAYKQLRKMLVDTSLIAVVSLPAGVFQPYSGVKTSILILDKALAKRCDSVLFVKVENDGFGLGAQRRLVAGSDLPEVVALMRQWFNSLRSGDSTTLDVSETCLIVSKEKIANNGEYNLSGERYRQGNQRLSQFPHVALEEVVEILDYLRRPITKHDRTPGPYPYYGATGVLDYVEGYIFDEPLVLVGEDGAKWGAGEQSAFSVQGKVWVNNHAHVLRPKRERLLDRFLIEILIEADLMPFITGVTVPKLNQEKLRSIEIPLPPLEVQQEIVAEIEGYQKVIDGARAVIDNYRPHIPINPEWQVVELKNVCDVRDGTHDSPKYVSEGYPLITSKNLKNGYIDFSDVNLISREDLDVINKRSKVDEGDILMPMIGTIGNPVIADASREYAVKNVALIKFYNGSKIINHFLKDVMASASMQRRFEQQSNGSTQKFIPLGFIRSLSIPLPPLTTQQAIVAEIEAEQALVNANRELITRFEKKIQVTLARVWGEEP